MSRKTILIGLAAGVSAVAAVGIAAALTIRTDVPSATPVSARPSPVELDAFAGTRIVFGHQSVGSNILNGIELVFASSEATKAPRIVDVETNPMTADAAFLAHAHIGVNGDPQSKLSHFSDLLAGPWGSAADVAILKFCYADISADTDVESLFREYSSVMSEVQARHPDITFLYATVPLTTDRSFAADLKALLGRDDHMGPDDNVARHRFNEMVRAEYRSSGRLFDIAAIESAYGQDPTARDRSGENYFVLHSAYSADAGHLNDAGARAVAAELIRVVAANTYS